MVSLQRSCIESFPVALHRMTRHINHDVADLKHLRGWLIGPSHPRADPGDQLLGFEWLDNVVICAGFEAEDDIYGVGLRGQHDDRHARLGTDLTAYVDAVRTWQHQVQQDQIRPGIPECLYRLVAI